MNVEVACNGVLRTANGKREAYSNQPIANVSVRKEGERVDVGCPCLRRGQCIAAESSQRTLCIQIFPQQEIKNTSNLSPREIKVLNLIAQGKRQTAHQSLFVSNRTVKEELNSIYSKYKVHSELEAILCGMQENIIDMAAAADYLALDTYKPLTSIQYQVLEARIHNPQKNMIEIAKDLDKHYVTVKKQIGVVQDRLRVVTIAQAAVFYMLAKQAGIDLKKPPQ